MLKIKHFEIVKYFKNCAIERQFVALLQNFNNIVKMCNLLFRIAHENKTNFFVIKTSKNKEVKL